VKSIFLSVLALTLTVATIGAQTKPVRLAVFPGEGDRAPADVDFTRMETALAADPEVALVERQQIRKILAEQKLTASVLANPATAARLGQLLSADLFLFVEKLPEPTAAAWRVEVIETRTGISLGGLISAEKSFKTDPKQISDLVQAAVAKWRIPPEKRRYLGILGVRSEELNRSLFGVAESFGMFLTIDLGKSPEVVILDRERLEHFQHEQELTGAENELKASALLLAGGVRQAETNGELRFTFSLSALKGGKARTFTVQVPEGDLNAARRAVARAILEQCQASVPRSSAANPKREAALFSQRAQILAAHGELEPAARAAEAALALYPSQKYQLQAAGAWQSLSSNLPDALRFWDLQMELINEHISRWKDNQPVPVKLPVVWNTFIAMEPLRTETGAQDAGTRASLAELRELCRTYYRVAREYNAARWEDRLSNAINDPQSQWTWLATEYVGWFADWSRDVEEWKGLMRDAVGQIDAPYGKQAVRLESNTTPLGYNQTFYFERLVDQVPAARFKSPEESRQVMEFYDLLSHNTNVCVRFCALAAKYNFIEESEHRRDAVIAQAALDIFLKDLPLDHYSRHWMNDNIFPSGAVDLVFRGLSDPATQDRYAHAILDPVLESGDSVRLDSWYPLIISHLNILETGGRKDAAYDWAGRLLQVFYAHPRDRGFVERLETLQLRLKGKLSVTPPVVPTPFQVEPVAIEPPPTDYGRLVQSCRQGGNLIMVWTQPGQAASDIHLRVTSVPLTGGPMAVRGETSFHSPLPVNEPWLEPVHAVVAGKDAIYVATVGGLVICRDGQATLWTEKQGLPYNDIASVALYDGKGYLGVGASAPLVLQQVASDFVEFDPATRHFTILASGRAQQKRNALDGGLPYTISGILPDEKRGCLWFSITGSARTGKRFGLWKFSPATGEFQQMTHDGYCLDRLAWADDKILGAEVDRSRGCDGLFAYDPDTLELITLSYSGRYREPKNGQSLFGKTRTPIWPCAWTLNGLLVSGGEGNRRLFWIADASAAPVALTRPDGEPLKDIRSLHSLGRQIFAVTAEGQLWSLRPGTSAKP